MTTLGEGGMLVVNNKKFQKFIPGLKHNGHREYLNKKKYWKPAMVDVFEHINQVTTFNITMTEIKDDKSIPNINNKLNIDRTIIPVSEVPTDPVSVHWQNLENVKNY